MNAGMAARAIEEQFPELRPAAVSYLGEGCDSTAFEVNGAWVFRFPKADDVEAQAEIEARILPMLAGWLPVSIPQFRFHGRPSPAFPRRFRGYAKIAGVPALGIELKLEPLVGRLARFLSTLHGFPLEDARVAGVPAQGFEAVVEEVREDALGDFEDVARLAPDAPLEAWRRYLERPPRSSGSKPRVLVHNDLAAEHVLVDPEAGSVTGVIDWSDVVIGDPAVDFAGLFHWGGESFAEAVRAAYTGRLDDHGMVRARYLAACRGAGDVAFGLKMRRPEYVSAGIRALRHCIEGAG